MVLVLGYYYYYDDDDYYCYVFPLPLPLVEVLGHSQGWFTSMFDLNDVLCKRYNNSFDLGLEISVAHIKCKVPTLVYIIWDENCIIIPKNSSTFIGLNEWMIAKYV